MKKQNWIWFLSLLLLATGAWAQPQQQSVAYALKLGQKVTVRIIEVDVARKTVQLSMKD